ncbi:hypothetical protein ACTFIZ_012369 [Dictyostelium cf. discoideum]
METMFGVPSTNTFAIYPGEDERIQFEGFYNTDLSNLEISNMVSDDSSTSSSSSTSHVSSSSGYIPISIDQTISRVNTNSNSTTLETGDYSFSNVVEFELVLTLLIVWSTTLETRDYSTFQSHVKSFIGTQNSGTSELLMKSWEQSTLKVYNSNYTRFLNFCTLNSLDPSNITLVVFMDYLTHLFNKRPPLAFSTINNHRSMLNQLLLLRNQTDIVNDPFITRIMTGIHKLRPSSAKYKEIWDANKVFKYLSTIKVLPKFTYTALLNKTLVLCKMFGLARSSDLVKGPVINAKEQRKDGILSNQPITTQNTEVENQRMKNEAHKILNKFKDIFVEQIPKFEPPSRQGFDMEVKVAEGSLPIKRSYNKMSEEESNKIGAEIKRLFEIGVIEESISSYSAPVLIATSKGKERVVFDYGGVNKQTEEFAFPMPNGEEILKATKDCKYFSVVDAKASFHLLQVKEEHRSYTAFILSYIYIYYE